VAALCLRRRRSVGRVAAMTSIRSVPAVALGAVLVAVLAAPLAVAQETASQLGGFVIGENGLPIAGARVTIVHVPSGTTDTATTTASGQFSSTGLRVGGPYRLTAEAEGMQPAIVEDLHTQLAERTSVTIVAQPVPTLAGIEVAGASERDVTIGPGSRYGSREVRELPSISRDIKDVVRVDPKAWVDRTNSDALEVAGVNNRYNTITVDGVRQSDDFGLNNNGYPTQRSPLSVDAIEAVSVLSAPFSVEYSFFRGSTINMVTRSGTNELRGSAFYYQGDDDLLGDETKDIEVDLEFDEEIYGGTLGGPIIRDRLFYFLSYEKLDRHAPQDIGPADSDFPVQVPGVTQAEYDRIRQIGLDIYNYDVGVMLRSAPEEDEKILAKLDWNIDDVHRATLAYQRTEGNELIVNDLNTDTSRNRLGAPSNWYDRGILMESTSAQLFSDWNENFSTEVKLARKEVETAQISLQGTEFGEMFINTPTGGTLAIGADESRHANALRNDVDSIKLKGNIFLDDHTLTVGYEREMLEIFNLFVARSQGQWNFASIDDFEDQVASSFRYQNAVSNDPADGAGSFSYDVDSFYVEDEWQATPYLKIQAGVRIDRFTGKDKPALNEGFTQRYGFNNQETLDGRDLIMPRVGFNWQWTPWTTVYGGWGLFGGGTPNVWVANSFSNDGVTVTQTDVNPASNINPQLAPVLVGGNGYDIPQEVLDFNSMLQGDGAVNSIDPDFEIPSQYRWNLGIQHTLPWDIELTADLIYSRVKQEVLWRDLRLQQVGTAPDGRPIHDQRDDGRNNPTLQDLMLTNTREGEGTILAIDFSKTWRTGAGRFDAFLGYGNQNVKDVNPGNSSTAASNWERVGTSDPNDPGLGTSSYEIEHRFTGSFAWRRAFFGDYDTSITLIGERRSGRPYSYTFGNATQAGVWGDPRQGGNAAARQLFYVPDGDVIFEAACTAADVANGIAGCASTAAFSSASPGAAQFASDMEAYVAQEGLERYRGRIVPRNSHRSPWLSVLDLRFAQELPVLGRTRGILTFDIENFANLINKDWGQLRQVSFPYFAPVVDVDRIETIGCPDAAASCYVYRPRSGQTGPATPFNAITTLPSVWRMQLGVRIEF
jgi:Carboxypeptidase regulatory-like domain/TonB dependent receptor/TonB-dependent Receptor Plug Domain